MNAANSTDYGKPRYISDAKAERNKWISTLKRHGQRDQNIDLERQNLRKCMNHTRSKEDLARL
uniref:Uncharacterized protein n=1 Tax=Megaselia scalaris TaxID=36166 RepID=T1GL08_MEGSC